MDYGVVYDRNQNRNWPILPADTGTDTQTIFQKKNLVTNSMVFFQSYKGPLNLICCQILKNKFRLWEKKCGYDTDTYQKWTLVSVFNTETWFR